jgi:hypothetical protein
MQFSLKGETEFTYVSHTHHCSKEITLTKISRPSPQACLVVLGGFFAQFATVGINSVFGVFEAYYKKNQLANESQFTISWLGAISVTCVYSGTFVVGSLVDKFGGRVS